MSTPVLAPAAPHRTAPGHRAGHPRGGHSRGRARPDGSPGRGGTPRREGTPGSAEAHDASLRRIVVVLAVVAGVLGPAAGIVTAATAGAGAAGTSQPSPSPQVTPLAP